MAGRRRALCRWHPQGAGKQAGISPTAGGNGIWVSPVFKQVSFQETYHDSGVQIFLMSTPGSAGRPARSGSIRARGIYVILDIILNHSGDVFAYNADRYPVELADGSTYMDPRWDGQPYGVGVP
ncbi:MAG: alpha-amylase family glycosyl hydrolase [Chloroflexota bacterium]